VIGVILMVAITVILAAVIAAFVFGMTGNVQTTKVVAVTVGQNGDDIVLTYQGGADAATLQYLTITVTKDGSSTDAVSYLWYDSTTKKTSTAPTTGDTPKILPVGTTTTITDSASPQQDHVVVAGHFADGSDHVVLNTYV